MWDFLPTSRFWPMVVLRKPLSTAQPSPGHLHLLLLLYPYSGPLYDRSRGPSRLLCPGLARTRESPRELREGHFCSSKTIAVYWFGVRMGLLIYSFNYFNVPIHISSTE